MKQRISYEAGTTRAWISGWQKDKLKSLLGQYRKDPRCKRALTKLLGEFENCTLPEIDGKHVGIREWVPYT